MATKSLTLWALLLAVVSTSTQTSASDADLLRVEADPPVGSRSGTEIYCVNPGDIGVNAGFGYGSEVADDIPTTLEGQSFNKVTLWVAQWLAPWVDPEGIVVNIYDEQCPPEQVAAHSYTIPWSELAPVLYGDFGFMVVYEVTALLPETHLISSTETRSIGGYVINDWGAAPPFCGFFCMEADDAPRGCAGLFWDNTTDGHPR